MDDYRGVRCSTTTSPVGEFGLPDSYGFEADGKPVNEPVLASMNEAP